MRNLDPQFEANLIKTPSTLCWCWLIIRVDGVMLGFTNLDISFSIDGVTYQPFTGFDPSASQTSGNLDKTDSQQLKGILDDSGISASDLASGIFEYAKVIRFLVDYNDLPSSLNLDPPKHLQLPTGYFAETIRSNLGYEVKVKDNLSLLENKIGESTSKTCRADLGDDRCLVDLSPFTHNLTITDVEDNRVFSVDGGLENKYFDRGRLQFTSGLNQGLYRDIGFYQQNKIILYPVAAPFDLQVGDTITAIAGCAKTKLACITKFQNFRNFVGEPDVPVTDITVETPKKEK